MPQPTVSAVHISAALTDIAVAFIQDETAYVADDVFPIVPVQHQANKYFYFSQDDFFRDEAQLRADGTESAGGGFNLGTASYAADVWAYHMDLGEQTRSNADPAVNMDVATTKFCMMKMLIRKDRFFSTQYMTTGVWTGGVSATDAVGTSGGTPGTSTPPYWSDDANGDPFTDIAAAQTNVLQNTGFEINTGLLTYPVYQALRKHPLVVDRIKYTTRADASKITPELLAAAFDVDRMLVSKAVYNSASESAAAVPTTASGTYSFIAGKNALFAHVAGAPGIMIPSAGYVFAWTGLSNMNSMGVRVSQIPMPWKGLGTVRTEAEMAFDMEVVAPTLGAFFSAIVQ